MARRRVKLKNPKPKTKRNKQSPLQRQLGAGRKYSSRGYRSS